MNLHENKNNFYLILEQISNKTNVDTAILEKDYYVTLVLKELFNSGLPFVFKGGTSLSKCFHVINRFSEDIDMNYLNHKTLTQGARKNIKGIVVNTANICGLKITNLEDTRSKRNFNQYHIAYENVYDNPSLKKEVIVEMAFQTESYPVEKKYVLSMIAEYFEKIGRYDLIEKYELQSFEVTVQSLVRTFIDKLFAIADYYMTNKIEQHSRHLYDLHKLYSYIKFDDSFYDLLFKVRKEREKNDYCVSAQEGIVLKEQLYRIIETNIFKNDYDKLTSKICFEHVDYQTIIYTLKEIINHL